MDILLDNPLASMYGPYFLVLYGFVILFTLILLGFAKTGVDKTNQLPLPPVPAEIDPFEIAYLRGGINEVARSVIFGLMQKGCVELEIEEKSSAIKRIHNRSDENLSEIEKLSLKWIGHSRDVGEVFQPNGLVAQLESYGLTYQNLLERRQMLIGDDLRNNFSVWKWSAFAVIFGLGFYKFLAAYIYGNSDVVLLVIFGVVGLTITYYSSKMPRVSKLGKAYLERLQLAFDNLKYQSQAGYIQNGERRGMQPTAFAGVDPLLLSVGIFGSGILVGTVFDSYNQAFQRSQQQSAACSCGSGCGSSCSSGDGGGGGCGGCGGGD